MSQSLDYAKEVYAACATIGFVEGPAATLKALLDRLADRQDLAEGHDVDEAELVRIAQVAHLAAANWAGR